MRDRDALSDLAVAMKRKLLNVNHDLRSARLQKYPDASRVAALKQTSKRLDRAYSACLHCAKSTDPVQLSKDHRTLLAIYQSS